MFPLKVYNVLLGKDVVDLPLHWHEELELIYIRSGSGLFYIDLKPYEAVEGSIILVNSGILHSGKPGEDGFCECQAVVFDLNMLKSFQMDNCQINYIAPILKNELALPVLINKDDSGYADMVYQVEGLIDLYAKQEIGFEIGIKGALLQIFSLLFRKDYLTQGSGKAERSRKAEKIYKIIEFIQQNYNRDIAVKEIAQIAGLSEFHFCKFFKAMTFQTFTEYLNTYRINQAVQLLLETNMAVTEIALEVGYENISYFIRTFKKMKSHSPNQFRKKYGK